MRFVLILAVVAGCSSTEVSSPAPRPAAEAHAGEREDLSQLLEASSGWLITPGMTPSAKASAVGASIGQRVSQCSDVTTQVTANAVQVRFVHRCNLGRFGTFVGSISSTFDDVDGIRVDLAGFTADGAMPIDGRCGVVLTATGLSMNDCTLRATAPSADCVPGLCGAVDTPVRCEPLHDCAAGAIGTPMQHLLRGVILLLADMSSSHASVAARP